MCEEFSYNNKILIVEYPESDRVGSTTLNKEQQAYLKGYVEEKFKEIVENNGGVFVLPPRTKIKIIDL
jgi:hypothetical protein